MKRLQIITLQCLIVASMVGCKNNSLNRLLGGRQDSEAKSASNPSHEGRLQWTSLEEGIISGCTEKGESVLKDQNSYQEFMVKLHTINGTPPPSMNWPPVDFTKETVVAVCKGNGANVLERVEIQDIQGASPSVVSAVNIRPGPNCIMPMVLPQGGFHPYHIVKIEETGKSYSFQYKDVEENCDPLPTPQAVIKVQAYYGPFIGAIGSDTPPTRRPFKTTVQLAICPLIGLGACEEQTFATDDQGQAVVPVARVGAYTFSGQPSDNPFPRLNPVTIKVTEIKNYDVELDYWTGIE